MAIMEISVVPIGAGTSVARYVAEAVRAMEGEPDIDYETTSMGTIISGDLDRLLDVARKMHQAVLKTGASRVYTTMKIDDRTDKPITMRSKLDSLRRELGERD